MREAFEAYKKYSLAAGFDVRKSTQTWNKRSDIIKRKFFVCSKEGSGKKESYDSLNGSSKKKKRRTEFRTSCSACLKVHLVGGRFYEVYEFKEAHNHCFVSPDDAYLQRSKRSMSYSHQHFVVKASNANIGPVRSYNLVKELSGSYDRVGATKVDFKNHSRDVLSLIKDKDAQMIVEKFRTKKETLPNFSFEYTIDTGGKLTSCFWADEASKLNYKAFGDVLSFDATFKTNK